jgi:parallel beta-helix repeat protein
MNLITLFLDIYVFLNYYVMRTIYLFLCAITTQVIFATNYYVSPSGNDNNNGLTLTTAFKTIEKATYAVAPGDTVFIRNGVYFKTDPESLIAYLTISGTASNPITYKAYPGETPILQLNKNNWAAITINGCDYIVIDGLTIIGNNDNVTLQYAQSQQLNIGNTATCGNGIAINTQYQNETNRPHHVIVRNCKISKCGGGGIYTYNADYVTIENNTVSECGWYAPYGNSGISMYQNWNSDTNTGFKNFITGNTCYRNENYIPFYVVGSITDGNGIIIDDNRNTQNNSTLGKYLGATYIANNLVFDNGGRGIHCFESDNVLAINNTCYNNCKSPAIKQGELTAYDASNITFTNNIVSPGNGVPPVNKDNNTTSNIIATNNLFTANQNLANPAGTNTIIGNASFVNPTVNATTADFHLKQNSLAINAGSLTNAPTKDKDGNIRLINNSIDIGCYEFQVPLTVDQYNQNPISFFPNPSQKYLSFKLNDNNLNKSELLIYNSIGKKVKTISINSESEIFTFDVSEFQSGIYFVNIIQDKTKTHLGKFIKQ